jgi:predicted AAA+ superfamily ATPase
MVDEVQEIEGWEKAINSVLAQDQVKVGMLDQLEIDFVAERHGERLYVQVAYLLSGPETIRREFGNLEQVPDNYPKLVLSMDELGPAQRNGIRQQNLVDFLLEPV